MLIRRKPFRYNRTKPRRGPERCPAYLAWIRTLRCAVCGRGPQEFTRVEAAHTTVLGPRGLSQKSSDFSAIPLCYWDHRGGSASYHQLGERQFAERHRLNLHALVSDLNEHFQNRPPHER
jgi:hypothetical protein